MQLWQPRPKAGKSVRYWRRDYLTKPFAFTELLARVQALIRRAGWAEYPTRLVAGDLIMDLLAIRQPPE